MKEVLKIRIFHLVPSLVLLGLTGCKHCPEPPMEDPLAGYWDVMSIVGIPQPIPEPDHPGSDHPHIKPESRFLLWSCQESSCDYKIWTKGFSPELSDEPVFRVPETNSDEFALLVGEGFHCQQACIVGLFLDAENLVHLIAMDKRDPAGADEVDCPNERSLCAQVVIKPVCRDDENSNCIPVSPETIATAGGDRQSLIDFILDDDTKLGATHFGHSHSGGEP